MTASHYHQGSANGGGGLEPDAPYDLVVTGATLLTAAPAGQVVHDAVVAMKNGRFVRVETAVPGATPLAVTRTLHLPGRVIPPGLVDVHTRANLSMVRGVGEDLGFAPAYTRGAQHRPVDTAQVADLF